MARLDDKATFAAFQASVARTYCGPWSQREQRFVHACGLSGEAGEVTDLIKKFEGHGHDFDREKLVNELGDVLYYVASCAMNYGIDLAEVAAANMQKVAARYPNGFSHEASRARQVAAAQPEKMPPLFDAASAKPWRP